MPFWLDQLRLRDRNNDRGALREFSRCCQWQSGGWGLVNAPGEGLPKRHNNDNSDDNDKDDKDDNDSKDSKGCRDDNDNGYDNDDRVVTYPNDDIDVNEDKIAVRRQRRG